MPPSAIQRALDQALQHHRAGRLQQAEQLYRQILTQQPDHPEALHLLGVLASQSGQHDTAVKLIRQAIALKPNFPTAHLNLGNTFKDLGRLDEAIAAYRQAIALKPNFPEALSNLGSALKDHGQVDAAITAYRQAITLKPNFPEAHNNLGSALKANDQLDDAIAAFRQAIALKPDFAAAHSNLAIALQDHGQFNAALAACRQALALQPNSPEAHNNFGIALRERGLLDDARAAFQQALTLQPDFPEAHCNLGLTLHDQGQLDAAIAAHRQALALQPNFPEAHNNLGQALKDQGELDAALAAYRQALALKPNFPEACRNLATILKEHGELEAARAAYHQAIALKPAFAEAHSDLALLLLWQGDFSAGFLEYEWRWKCPNFRPFYRSFPQPQWDGSPLAGRTILLHAEQGLGDTLQFCRYVPLVAAQGGRIILACQPELHRLLQNVPSLGFHQLLSRGQPLPTFDVHCPLLSLPHVLHTTLETIPCEVPYLRADPALVQHCHNKLAATCTDPTEPRVETRGQPTPVPAPNRRVKVGLAWAGLPTHPNDIHRSLTLAAFAPLAAVPNITFYSLQKGKRASDAADPPPGMHLVDLTPDLHDFADTAALIANLDLIISVDTSIVHLAGALAKPVWTLLPFLPDWRWLQDRPDSPWYPTMRLFRQQTQEQEPADWPAVLTQVAAALGQFASSAHGPSFHRDPRS